MSQFVVKASNVTRDSMRQMYIHKTISRLEQLKSNPLFQQFFTETIVINNTPYYCLNEYMQRLPEIIEQELIDKSDTDFSIIHGDLCFSNILLEETKGFVRVIDPRGEFGSFDIYGDPRYEMAKLLHSIEGKYDFIIEDMFEVSVTDTCITYKIPKDTQRLVQLFYGIFGTQLGNVSNVRLIESTLFLSMIPLHSDFITRQYVMLATGIIQLDQVLKEKGYE